MLEAMAEDLRVTSRLVIPAGELHERFGDWQLAILAYNMGEGAVERAIQRAGTRDPWKLVALGYEGDARYLARVMAGVLILKNPGSSL